MSIKVFAALAAVGTIWGSTYFAIRVGLESFPPFMMGAIRFVFAGALMYAVLRARGAAAPTMKQWAASAWVGVLLFVVSNGGVSVGEERVSSSVASVVVATMPLWAVLFGRFWGARPARAELVGLGLGFVGVALLHAGGDLFGNGWSTLVLVISPAAWALGSVWSRRLPMPSGAMATATTMLTGGIGMGVVALALGERVTEAPSARSIVAVVYLVVFGSLVAYTAYIYLLGATRPAVATSYAYVNPVVAVFLGVAFGGETIGWATIVGAGVILSGVFLLNKAKAKAVPAETAASLASEPAPEAAAAE